MRSLVVAVLLACGSFARAETVEELLEQLTVELRREAATGSEQAHLAASVLQQLAAAEGGDRHLQLPAALDRFDFSESHPRIRQLIARLGVQAKKERQEQNEKLRTELTPLLQKALREGLDAKTPAELDKPIQALAPYADRQQRAAHWASQRLLQQAEQLSGLLREIQNQLAGVRDPRYEGGRASVDSWLSRCDEFVDLLPRSEILTKLRDLQQRLGPIDFHSGFRGPAPDPARAERERAIAERIGKIKTLAEIRPALKENWFDEFREGGSGPLFEDIRMLEQMAKTYERVMGGQVESLQGSGILGRYSAPAPDSALQPLHREMMLLVLHRGLALPEEDRARGGESPAAYLERLKKRALDGGNWEQLRRIVDAASLVSLPTIATSGDSNALSSFLSAEACREARQYSLAANGYLSAVRTGSRLIPLKQIGDRLEEIRRDHPAEYEAGLQMTVAPRAPYGTPGAPPFYPAGRMPPGAPGMRPVPPPGVTREPAPPTATPPPTTPPSTPPPKPAQP